MEKKNNIWIYLPTMTVFNNRKEAKQALGNRNYVRALRNGEIRYSNK